MDSQAWTRLTNDQEQELDCLEFDEPEVGQFIQHQSQQCGYTGDWSVDAAPPVWDRWAEGWVRHQPGQGSGHQEPEQGRSSSWRSHDQPEQGTSSSWRSHGQPEQCTSSSWRSHGQAEQGRSSSWWCNEPEQGRSSSWRSSPEPEQRQPRYSKVEPGKAQFAFCSHCVVIDFLSACSTTNMSICDVNVSICSLQGSALCLT